MGIHLAEFFGFFEAIRTTIRSILALQIEVPASLARSISIALNFTPLAFVATKSD